MMTGVPVVPEEEWMRTICSSGAVIRPRGYASRRSAFSEKGSFSKTEDIKNVSGIGEGTYEKIKEKITV